MYSEVLCPKLGSLTGDTKMFIHTVTHTVPMCIRFTCISSHSSRLLGDNLVHVLMFEWGERQEEMLRRHAVVMDTTVTQSPVL